jgi:hypothetical protein
MQPTLAVHAAVVPYSVATFNNLPEFNESKGRFSEKQHVLDSLGSIIRAHGAQKFLGAALIHKHFPLHDGECVVEEVRPDGSLLGPRFGMQEDLLIPYLWHLSKPSPVVFKWTPVEFVVAATVPDSVRKFAKELPQREALLNELAAVLAESHAQETFGLALLHRQGVQFDRKVQVLLESPGPFDRTLKVTAENPSVTASADWTQTYWHFDVDSKSIINGCSQHGCAGYCSDHTGNNPPPPSSL